MSSFVGFWWLEAKTLYLLCNVIHKIIPRTNVYVNVVNHKSLHLHSQCGALWMNLWLNNTHKYRHGTTELKSVEIMHELYVGERGANEAPGQKRPLLRFLLTAQGCKGVAGYCLCLVRATFSALTCSMKHGS